MRTQKLKTQQQSTLNDWMLQIWSKIWVVFFFFIYMEYIKIDTFLFYFQNESSIFSDNAFVLHDKIKVHKSIQLWQGGEKGTAHRQSSRKNKSVKVYSTLLRTNVYKTWVKEANMSVCSGQHFCITADSLVNVLPVCLCEESAESCGSVCETVFSNEYYLTWRPGRTNWTNQSVLHSLNVTAIICCNLHSR